MQVGENFIDQLFYLGDRVHLNWRQPIWEGYIKDLPHGTFDKGAWDLVQLGVLTQPGPYCLVRLDRSIDPTALPCITWVGVVTEDRGILHEIEVAPQATNFSTWPPK